MMSRLTLNLFSQWFEAFARWLLPALTLTCLAGLIYLVAQQNLRQSANYPQVQMAEDAAAALAGGAQPHALLPAQAINMSASLAPYLMLFDEQGQLIESSAQLDGKPPILPEGVLAYAKAHGEHRLTWQPRPGVRSAIVVMPYQGARSGYVVAGRSLRESENQTQNLGLLVMLGWLVSLGGMLVASVALEVGRAWWLRDAGAQPV